MNRVCDFIITEPTHERECHLIATLWTKIGCRRLAGSIVRAQVSKYLSTPAIGAIFSSSSCYVLPNVLVIHLPSLASFLTCVQIYILTILIFSF